jgi:hypothetical protein
MHWLLESARPKSEANFNKQENTHGVDERPASADSGSGHDSSAGVDGAQREALWGRQPGRQEWQVTTNPGRKNKEGEAALRQPP